MQILSLLYSSALFSRPRLCLSPGWVECNHFSKGIKKKTFPKTFEKRKGGKESSQNTPRATEHFMILSVSWLTFSYWNPSLFFIPVSNELETEKAFPAWTVPWRRRKSKSIGSVSRDESIEFNFCGSSYSGDGPLTTGCNWNLQLLYNNTTAKAGTTTGQVKRELTPHTRRRSGSKLKVEKARPSEKSNLHVSSPVGRSQWDKSEDVPFLQFLWPYFISLVVEEKSWDCMLVPPESPTWSVLLEKARKKLFPKFGMFYALETMGVGEWISTRGGYYS